MTRHTTVRVCGAVLVCLFAILSACPLNAQSLYSVIEPHTRVFPTVGAGVTAIKRDPSGHYYVLAKPMTVISVYDANGNLVRQIPNENSQGVKIRYAVDMDLGSDGALLVADRGSNSVDVFNSDGSVAAKVPVMAPTSVVALPDGEFAVTSLTSKRLVQVMDESGNVIRTFGDPGDLEDAAPANAEKKPMVEWGKITASPAGDIYFAFTSRPEPLLRKYDRYGYVAYEATVPKSFFERGATSPNDRVEFTLNVTHLSFSDQTAGWFSVGSSGDMKFGGGMGTGLSRILGSGGSFGRAAMQMGAWQGGGGGPTPGGMAGGSLGGMFSGTLSGEGTNFQFGAGNIASLRGGGRRRGGGAGGSAAFDDLAPQGDALQYFGSGNTGASDSASDPYGDAVLSYTGANSSSSFGDTSVLSADAAYNTSGFAQNNAALPAAFAYGAMFNAIGFAPTGGPAEGRFGGVPGGAERFGHMGGPGAEMRGGSGTHFGDAHFGPHGRFGAGEEDVTATVRVNIGDLGGKTLDKPVITATAVDPTTHDVWAGIGDTLVHFSKDGNPIEVFYLTLKGGTPLKPTAVLVEPDRFLVAVDPWGIFEFSR